MNLEGPYRSENIIIHTQDSYLGISNIENYVKTGVPLQMELAALNKNGKPAGPIKAVVQITKYEYKTVMEKSQSGYYNYRSQRDQNIVIQDTIKITGNKKSFLYTPKFSGEYKVELFEPGSDNKATREFYAHGFGQTLSTAYEVDNVGKIEIVSDKKKYQSGDKARLLFKTPFAGKLLVTLEKETVLKHYFIDTDKKAAALDIILYEDMLPNVYNCYLTKTTSR